MTDGIRFPHAEAGSTCIANVTVVPMNSPGIIPGQTVVIEGGAITAVGPSAEIRRGDSRVVDGSGKYLAPGLADMHVHYWDIGEFGMFLANGVTQVRNMWGSPFHLALQRKVREGSFPGPRVVTTSPIIDGPGANGATIWPGSPMAADPSQAETLVAEFAARGYQQTKAYSWLKLDVLQALGKASHNAGIRVVGHCPDGITYEEAIDAGMTCFEHLTGIAVGRIGGRSLQGLRPGSLDAMRTVVENLELDSIRRLAHLLAERDIWNCPTLVVWQGMSQEESVAMADPRLMYEPATTVAGWNPANDFRLRSTTTARAEWLALAQARNDLYRQVISILHEEGAPLLVGTDTPNPFVFQGFAIHQEMANFVAAGLTPYQALRCATVEAARFLGEETTWGTVEVGKRADLLLLPADPLDDLTALLHPEAVFVNEYVFLRADLDALLTQRAESVRGSTESSDVDLEPSEAGGTVVSEGHLAEKLAGMDAGSVHYRHTRMPDETWLIEEAAQSGADSLRSWGGWSSSRLELSPTFDVVRGIVRSESFLGVEEIDIRRDEDDTYAVRCTEIDGFETTSRLSGPLTAGEELAVTAFPLFLGQRQTKEGTLSVLGIDRAHAAAIPLQLAETSDGGDEQEWHVHVERFGTPSDQIYRLTASGTLLNIEEQTWRGTREVTPADSTK